MQKIAVRTAHGSSIRLSHRLIPAAAHLHLVQEIPVLDIVRLHVDRFLPCMRFRFYIISQSGIGRCVQIMPAGTVTGDAVQYIHRFCKMAAVDVIGRRIQTERILIVGILSALLISAKTTETAKSSEPAVAGTKSTITLSLALSIAAIPVIRGAAFPRPSQSDHRPAALP